MKLKYWGVKGSLPFSETPDMRNRRLKKLFEDFFDGGNTKKEDIESFLGSQPRYKTGGYGTATTNVAIDAGDIRIHIDAGSGLANAADSLMSGPCGKGKGEVHLLFTHFHWDHMMGLPFFPPIFIPGNTIHFYAVQDELQSHVERMFTKPNFPVPYSALGAKICFHKLEPRIPFNIGELLITPYLLDHPDPCWGFKIVHNDKVYSHCVDTECVRMSRNDMGEDLPLYQGVDLMYFDSQYSLEELTEKSNWGHSSANIGLDIAIREKIKRVIFAHHDPKASESRIAAAETTTREYYEWLRQREVDAFSDVEWSFAFEGMEIDL